MNPGMEREIPLRITLVHPPRDVVFCLQRGQQEIVSPVRASGDDLSFELSVRVRDGRADGLPNFVASMATCFDRWLITGRCRLVIGNYCQ